jgi:steroid 5-alpha reductase family enzyme
VSATSVERQRGFLWIFLAYAVAAVVGVAAGVAYGGERHPLAVVLVADLAATLAIFAFSYRFDNSSFYDAYWSVAPLPIGVYWALRPEASAAPGWRQAAVLAALAIWGGRLTFNWARGWEGLRHEDWRYEKLRREQGKLYWLVSLAGLHLAPTMWVWMGLLPVYVAVCRGSAPLGPLDLFAALVTGGAIWIEARADRELRAFRTKGARPGEILAEGLWAYSRHPNYFGEMSFWWGLFLFGMAADPAAWWSAIGAVSITLMFRFASLPMMETRMQERRPGYAEHAARTSLVVPWPRRR